ncbi:hypothetical protein HDU98_003595, partial [Podochytrium sp. JEL0797]
MSVVVRFRSRRDGRVKEHLLGLIHVADMTAEALFRAVMAVNSRFKLDIRTLRGQ